LLSVVVLYVSATLGLYVFQRDLLYFPPLNYVAPLAAHAPPALRELTVRTEDGLDLKGWYAPASGKPLTIVYFHGNGDSLASAAPVAAPYIAAGYGFLVAEYRGYGGMPGSPTENGLYSDGRAYVMSLIRSGVREGDIVVFGYSLGTGVATRMATEFHLRGVMLFAPYLSIAELAQVSFPFLPAAALTRDRFDNAGRITGIHVPILIANGDWDQVVPPEQGRELFARANQPKTSLFLTNAGHGDVMAPAFTSLGLSWLAGVSGGGGSVQ
jgi:fermentation-respiration switch protein FrsA (DUF1100 family)